MNLLNSILLQAQAQEGGGWSGMIMILAMIVIFYFFMIRPQSKKQKELKRAREAMKKGDKVVTAGGIHGRIKELDDTVVYMEIAQGVTIKIDKGSVFAVPVASGQSNKVTKDKTPNQNKGAENETDVEVEGAELEAAAGKVAKKKK